MLPLTFPNEGLLPEKVLFPITTLTLPCHNTNKIVISEEAPQVYYLKIMLKIVKHVVNHLSKNSQILVAHICGVSLALFNSHKEACLTEN